jgi:hypothetical protein
MQAVCRTKFVRVSENKRKAEEYKTFSGTRRLDACASLRPPQQGRNGG